MTNICILFYCSSINGISPAVYWRVARNLMAGPIFVCSKSLSFYLDGALMRHVQINPSNYTYLSHQRSDFILSIF